jgi:hypothetical protein
MSEQEAREAPPIVEGDHVWVTDDQGRRRTGVVFARQEDGDLIVTGVGMESHRRHWRIPAQDVAAKLSRRDPGEQDDIG